MFLRSVKARNGQQEYLRLVESFREGTRSSNASSLTWDARICWRRTWMP